MEKYQDILTIIGPPGLIPIVGANVTVLNFGTSTNATIYSSNGTTAPATNPLTTDNSGRFSFYAPDGRYTLSMSGTSIQTTVLTDIQLFDAAASTGTVFPTGVNVTIATDALPSRFYRADATFNGTVDHGTFLGYNVDSFGQIQDFARPSMMIGVEEDYNSNGTTHITEFHVNLYVPVAGGYKRPFAGYMYASSGTLDVAIIGDSQVGVFAPLLYTTANEVRITSGETVGPRLNIINSSSKSWGLYSTGAGSGLGSGKLVFFNNTDAVAALQLSSSGVAIVSSAINAFGASSVTQASVSSVITTTGLSSTGAFGFSSAAAAQSMVDAVRFLQQAMKQYGFSS